MAAIDLQPATRFCLVRHGETEWNAQRRLQGHTDIDLNQAGLRQAEAAGSWLASLTFNALYSSDLKRAWKTAEVIGKSLGLTPRSVPELREQCYGVLEGLTFDEAIAGYPAGYAAFRRRDPGYDPGYDFETGESLTAMFARVTGKLKALTATHRGETAAIVLHGGVLDVINRFVQGSSLDKPRDFPLPNAGLSWITCNGGRWQIDSWGETAHLKPLPWTS